MKKYKIEFDWINSWTKLGVTLFACDITWGDGFDFHILIFGVGFWVEVYGK